MIITDVKWQKKGGDIKQDYYMDGYLAENLAGIPRHLKKDWDVVGIVSGSGKVRVAKCQIKGDVVLMSDGSWKNIENIKVDDEVVSPQKDGSYKFVKVKNTHNRFEEEVYNVIENKSGKVLYSCAGNHLIPVHRPQSKRYISKDGKEKRKTWKVLDNYDAKHISKLYTSRGKITSFSTTAVNFKNKKDSKIEPYSIGAYLGDGSFSVCKKKSNSRKDNFFIQGHYRTMKNGKRIWQEGHYVKNGQKHYKGIRTRRDLCITSADKEIINEVSKYYPVISSYDKEGTKAKMFRFSVIGEFAKQLKRLGLEGKGSAEKFIPKECLLSSIDYRFKLLAGLIDTDGTVGKNNHCSITTKSKRLAEDIKDLVFSLGGYANIKKTIGKCENFEGVYYKIGVSFKDPKIIPLKVRRKINRLSKMKDDPKNIGIECVKTNPQKVYGIEIEGESKWYVTNDWMVTHNSTIAMQVGFFVTWLLAGGEMNLIRGDKDYGKVIKTPQTKVIFDLNKNIVFDVETLMKRGHELPMNSVIVYDEGREGLDAKSTMMNINRTLENFFQECGVYNHFIIIVLPDFFSLNKNFATSRSNFLINTYVDEQYNRGYFAFYNERKKEKLYEFGRRKLGTFARYVSEAPNFRGRFTKWLPFSKIVYDNLKKEALRKKRLSRTDVRISKQRDVLIYLYKKLADLNSKELSDEINKQFGVRIPPGVIRTALQNAIKIEESKMYLDSQEDED